MADLLQHIVRRKSDNSHWSRAILEKSCPTVEACSCGFSELGSYASWMKKMHPKSVAEVAQQWGHPVKPRPGTLRSHSQCCPTSDHELDPQRGQGNLAVVFNRHRDCTKKKAQTTRLMRLADGPPATIPRDD